MIIFSRINLKKTWRVAKSAIIIYILAGRVKIFNNIAEVVYLCIIKTVYCSNFKEI